MSVSRYVQEAKYILKHKCTIRETAKYFGLSKSTIHNDLNVKLAKDSKHLFRKVRRLLDYNYQIKHIRGGLSTASKYKKAK